MKFQIKAKFRPFAVFFILPIFYFMGACGGSAVGTSSPNEIPAAINPPPAPNSGPSAPKITQIVKNALSLGASLYPPDLDIPNIPG